MIVVLAILVVCALAGALVGSRRGIDPVSCAAGGLVLGPLVFLAMGLIEKGTPLTAKAPEPVQTTASSPELAGPVVPSFSAPPPDKSRSELVAELAASAPVTPAAAVDAEPVVPELSVRVVTEALPAEQAQAPTEATMMSCPHCGQASYVDHYGLCALCAEPLLKAL